MTTSIRKIMEQEVAEGGSALLTWTFQDELGAPVPLASIGTLEWTHYNEATGLVINSRTAVNIKNANGGTVHATSGACTLIITPADNIVVDQTLQWERHIAYLKGTYNGGAGVVEVEALITVRNLLKVP